MSEKKGTPFERLVAAVHDRLGPKANVTHNEWVTGRSGVLRQIDVAARGRVNGHEVFIVIECKDKDPGLARNTVGIDLIEAFYGMLHDVGATQGVMVTTVGYTKGALKRAAVDGIITSVLRPARDEDWHGYLHSIELNLDLSEVRLRDCTVELVGETIVPVDEKEMLYDPDSDSKFQFFDMIVHGWLRTIPRENGETVVVPLGSQLRLIQGDDEEEFPKIRSLRCRPCREAAGTLTVLREARENHVFVQCLPGQQIGEKRFLEFVELEKATRKFNPRTPQ